MVTKSTAVTLPSPSSHSTAVHLNYVFLYTVVSDTKSYHDFMKNVVAVTQSERATTRRRSLALTVFMAQCGLELVGVYCANRFAH